VADLLIEVLQLGLAGGYLQRCPVQPVLEPAASVAFPPAGTGELRAEPDAVLEDVEVSSAESVALALTGGDPVEDRLLLGRSHLGRSARLQRRTSFHLGRGFDG
jgi:hypothetical protein